MNSSPSRILSAARRKPLAACVATLFALAAPEVFASNIWPVTNCSDHDPGSLRSVVGAVTTASGDTVDLSGLTCSRISLSTGAIVVNQSSLTLQGPGASALNVFVDLEKYSSSKVDRVIKHEGYGSLTISGLTIAGGTYAGAPGTSNRPALGGCIYSRGSVELAHSMVYGCLAGNFNNAPYTTDGSASGGAIFTLGNLTLIHSSVTNSESVASYAYGIGYGGSGFARGGGVFANGNLVAKYSTISGNQAFLYVPTPPAVGPYHTLGGGVFAARNASIFESTISTNQAGQGAGIFVTSALPAQATLTIGNSTISGNFAHSAGAIYANISANIYNSTIAFNQINKTGYSRYAGIVFSARNGSFGVNLQSALIANNSTYHAAASDDDISVLHNGANTVTITGANNLVMAGGPGVDSFPGDTIIGKCPLLKPLANNGGETQSHALMSGSPAIDAGNDAANLNYDQRWGPTPAPNPLPAPPIGYPRISGTATDIGAFEVQQADAIFNAGFEGCP